MSQYQQSRLLGQAAAVNYHSPVKIGAPPAAAVPLDPTSVAHSAAGSASGSNSPLVRPIARLHSPHSPSASSQPAGSNSPKSLSINSTHRYTEQQPLSPSHIAAQQQLIGQQQQQAAQMAAAAAAQQFGGLPQLPSLPFPGNPYLSELSGASAASSPKLSTNDESPLPPLPVAGLSNNNFSSSPDAMGRSLLPGAQSYMGLPSVGTPPPQSANPYSNFFFPPPLLTGTSPSTTAPASPNLHNAQSPMFGFGRSSGAPPTGSGPSPPTSAAGAPNPFASMMLPWQQLMTAGGQNALQQMSAMNNLGMSAALQQQMALKFPNPFLPTLPGSPSMGYGGLFNQQPPNGSSGVAGSGPVAAGAAANGAAAPANFFAGMSGFDFPGLNPNSFADPISRINSPSVDGTSTPPPATALNPLAGYNPFLSGWSNPMDPMAAMYNMQNVMAAAASANSNKNQPKGPSSRAIQNPLFPPPSSFGSFDFMQAFMQQQQQQQQQMQQQPQPAQAITAPAAQPSKKRSARAAAAAAAAAAAESASTGNNAEAPGETADGSAATGATPAPTVGAGSAGGGGSSSGRRKAPRTYQCQQPGCRETLKTRFSLKRHMKKHTGEKPHTCPYAGCMKSFPEASTLKRHVRIHTGEKPFKCRFPSCNKAFADATNVKRHEMTHTGEKPYRCLTGDHMVLTRSGWRSITHIAINELVAGIDVGNLPAVKKDESATYTMQWKRVTAVQSFPAAQQQLYRMQSSEMDIVATRDHSMLLAHIALGKLSKHQPFGYHPVQELLPLSYSSGQSNTVTMFDVNCSRAVLRAGDNTQPAVKLVVPGLEAVCDWWWQVDQQAGFLRFIGFWLGDGHLCLHRSLVTVSQRKEDSNEWLIDLLNEVFPNRWYSDHSHANSTGTTLNYVISCPPLVDWLRGLAAGPLGYNPLDPVAQRRYPHFAFHAGLATEEVKSRYRLPTPTHRGLWSEEKMLAEMQAAERCWWCRHAVWEEGNDTLRCEGDDCHNGGHLRCAGVSKVPRDNWLCPTCRDGVAAVAVEAPQVVVVVKVMVSQPAAETENMEEEEKEEKKEGQDEDEEKVEEMAVETPYAEVVRAEDYDETVGEEMRVAGKIVWWNKGEWLIIDGRWFYLKRWMGEDVSHTFANLSQRQAVALLEGFCRADGRWSAANLDKQTGAPLGRWECSNSSFPLIDQLQLIGQLAGACVDLSIQSQADGGRVSFMDGRAMSAKVDHWQLSFTFARPGRVPLAHSSLLARPVDVTADLCARGNYKYEDDGRVYDISVEGNHNFLTQRLSVQTLENGRLGVQAHPVLTGNCLVTDCYRSFSRGSSLKQHMITQHKLPADSPLLAASVRRGQAIKQGNFSLFDGTDDSTAAGATQQQLQGEVKPDGSGADSTDAVIGGTAAADGAAVLAALDEESEEEGEGDEEEDEEEEDDEDEDEEAAEEGDDVGDGKEDAGQPLPKRLKVESKAADEAESASSDQAAAAKEEPGASS